MSNRTMPHPRTVIAAALAMLGGAAGAVAAGAPVLQLPLACDIGRNCFIQTYVDADPSPLARDYMCGARAQDGHNGTDFRLPSMAAQRDGVDVLAAADGRVLRQRDGMADVPVAGSDHSAVQNTECGNGLVIDHGGGWETQYCHLAKGSLRLKPGEMVKAGQPVGRVGLSGLSQYPHVHFTVRHGGRIIDPFAHDAPPGSCGAGASLWAPALQPGLAYRPRAIINHGFASGPVTMQMVEEARTGQAPDGADAAALVAYIRAIGLQAGDIQLLTVKDPSGHVIAENRAKPMERNQAQTLLYAGRKRPQDGWRPGLYQASYRVTRDGAVVLEQDFSVELREQP